ncbi:glycosyltransferase family 2 protein [Chitinophaga solisilvae]|uniref:glycosyltransferase family 2 protein n=1 Tax=Chitinophaga solisilvae TaxID=1233460 RepID=UPI00136D35D1|nr:glycosyltransferase family 2 protein [Chitinophaga solisilvae]
MIIAQTLFIISLIILFYNYIGYGLLLYVLVQLKKVFRKNGTVISFYEPDVTLIVAAYNEEAFIREKIRNTLELDYPAGKLHIIIVTDGSTDRTPQIIEQYPAITLLHQAGRNGKTAALNRAMEQVRTPIVVFCDANTLLNTTSIRNIAKHYADPLTGGVAGEKKVISGAGDNGAAGTEGIYWKYESVLKRLDAQLYSVVGAAGELFSIRTALFEPVAPEVILDDFVISLRINQQGYRIAYAPDAYAMEAPSYDIREEHKRKVRISAGGFQAIVMLRSLLNVFRYPVLSFQYISHRVLRWTLSPLSLPVLLLSNAWLLFHTGSIFYSMFMALQLAAYLAALTGFILAGRNIRTKIFYIPFYFLFMNIAVYQGFFRFLLNSQSAAWEKSKRKMQTT